MSNVKLKHLADFEWAGVARYIVYVSAASGLQEINSNHVNSFPLARLGPEALLKQKKRVLLILAGNRTGIERFVGRYKAELTRDELSVLRSLYFQYRDNEQTVRDHIGVVGQIIVEIEVGILQSKEIDNDGLF